MNVSTKTYKTALLSAVFALVIFISSCSNMGDSASGYTTTANGLQYKVITDNKGPKAKAGDYVKFYTTLRTTDDKLILSLSTLKIPDYATIDKPRSKGDPLEALALMGKGDSVSCLIPAETFFKGYEMPAPLKNGDKVKLDIKVIDILNKEQYHHEMDEIAANHVDPQEKDIKDYIAKNNLDAKRLPDGMYYVIDKPGTGKQPKAGDKVKVNYRGTLLDGTQFDSSLDPGRQPFEFTLGQQQVIKGWDEGIPLFKVGGKGKLLIPSSLGYGESGSGKIPPNAPLVFDIEVLGVN